MCGIRFGPTHTTVLSILFFFNDTATTEIYTLSLHDALPISVIIVIGDNHLGGLKLAKPGGPGASHRFDLHRSEEHTSELQSPCNLVCRLLLEKKKFSILRMGATVSLLVLLLGVLRLLGVTRA